MIRHRTAKHVIELEAQGPNGRSLTSIIGGSAPHLYHTSTWEQLGKLGVIAVIRTFLNYFLGREVKEIETEEVNGKPLGNTKTDEQEKPHTE